MNVYAVIDTNVIVSSILSSHSDSATVLRITCRIQRGA